MRREERREREERDEKRGKKRVRGKGWRVEIRGGERGAKRGGPGLLGERRGSKRP